MKRNSVIDALTVCPCVEKELPYPVRSDMALEGRRRIMKIKVAGTRTNRRCNRCGRFITVYYLDGDEDRAVKKFVDVNKDTLGRIDFSRNSVLDSGLHRQIVRKIRDVVR